VIFREAAINAAVEALGLPVPAVWSVQQIDGRWGIVFADARGSEDAGVWRQGHPASAQRMKPHSPGRPVCRFAPQRRFRQTSP
jgi:hypothetical protein